MGKGIAYAGDKLGIKAIKKSGSSIVSWAENLISQLVNNPVVKSVTSSKLAPAAATGALVAGINQYTGRDNKVFAGSFGERGDEIFATSQGIPTEKEQQDMMTSLSKIEPDYEGLLP